MTSRTALLLALLGLPAAGCGGKPAPVPAGGKVTVRGKPAAGAMVVFHPKTPGRENDPKPFAVARDDGTFELSLSGMGDGSLEGDYGVTVVWNAPADPKRDAKFAIGGDEGAPKLTDRLAGRYGNPRAPKLSATVKAGGENRFAFELE